MLDITFIRENAEQIKAAAQNKRFEVDIDKILELDESRRSLITEVEALKAEKNASSKAIPTLADDEKKAAIAAMQELGEKEKALSEKLKEVQDQYDLLMLQVPQIHHPEVPIGKDDTENVQIRTWGEIPAKESVPKSHIELGMDLDMIDVERGVKVSGARHYFLKGEGARLELALHAFTLDMLKKKGFTQLNPPVIVNNKAMFDTGYYPGGEEDAYQMERDEQSLVGTSEVPITAFHSDEVLKEGQFPLLYSGFSSCFRREAGTYGKDTHGIYRVHQFQKVEQVVFCKNDFAESEKMHQLILQNAEDIMQALELPYQVVDICTGDLGKGQYRKFDIEAWMPSRDSYGETHSASMFLDFQARRLKTRYKDAEGNIHFAHTLNSTALPTPRALIAFMEIHQQADGSIRIPEVLQPYLGGQTHITKN